MEHMLGKDQPSEQESKENVGMVKYHASGFVNDLCLSTRISSC